MIAHAEVRRVLGNLEDERVVEIVKLRPSLAEVELAAACLDGRTHILTRSGLHLSTTAARIMEIVLSDEIALDRGR